MLRQGLNLGSVCKSQAFCMMCCPLPLRSRDWCLLDYGQKALWAGHQKHSAIFTYPFIPLVSRAKVLNDTCTPSSIPQGASGPIIRSGDGPSGRQEPRANLLCAWNKSSSQWPPFLHTISTPRAVSLSPTSNSCHINKPRESQAHEF